MFKVTASLRFFKFNCTRLRAAVDNRALRLSPLYYDGGQQVAHSGRHHAESIIFNRGRSVAMWTFTGRVFHPAQRPPPLNGHRLVFSICVKYVT